MRKDKPNGQKKRKMYKKNQNKTTLKPKKVENQLQKNVLSIEKAKKVTGQSVKTS